MPSQNRLLVNANLVDAESASVTGDCWVRIEGGLIAGIGRGDVAPGEAVVEDLGGAFVIPGLWDVHVHPAGYMPRPASETTAQRMARAIEELMAALRVGITSVRSAGEAAYIDCALKDLFAGEHVPGPRVVPTGYFLTTTGGHADDDSREALFLDGPVAWRNAVREQICHGTEFVKLNLSGGLLGPAWDDITSMFELPDELEAAFGTANQRGVPVMSHATNPRAVKAAVAGGTRSVEHGYLLDDGSVAAMLNAGTYFVPTLTFSQLAGGVVRDAYEQAASDALGFPEEYRAKAPRAAADAEESFKLALRSGVRIACGTDVNPVSGGAKIELAMFVRFGMTPAEALVAATKTSAELCGYGAVSGTIAPGKEADLVALGANPLEDIAAVHDVRGVWRLGRRVA